MNLWVKKLTLLAALVLSSSPDAIQAFAVFRPSNGCGRVSALSSSLPSPLSTRTCLRAEAGEEQATPSEDPQPEGEEQPGEEAPAAAATDILNSPAFLERKLEVIKNDIAKVEEDLEAAKARLAAGKQEWGPQLDDLRKKYETIQSRMTEQNKQGDSMATVQVARQVLGMLDNFDRALGVVTPETTQDQAIEAEYVKTYDMILETFEKLGIEPVETIGTEFDYEVHQAVMQRPSDEYEEGVVCEELQKGYKIGDTLVRAAMVAVAV